MLKNDLVGALVHDNANRRGAVEFVDGNVICVKFRNNNISSLETYSFNDINISIFIDQISSDSNLDTKANLHLVTGKSSDSVFVDDSLLKIENDIYYLGNYYPYTDFKDKRKNNIFATYDFFSSDILKLKIYQDARVIEYFFDFLDSIVQKDVAVAVVPGHDPNNTNYGIRTLAEMLAADRIDATKSLRKVIATETKANGGSRDLNTLMNSIEVINTDIIADKNVLILDDITTSGTSLKGTSILIEPYTNRDIFCLALGKTVSSNYKKKGGEK